MATENNNITVETNPEIQEVPEVKVRRRGKGKKAVKLTEDPAYFSNYWREKRSVKAVCENCGRWCVKGKMYGHRTSNICKKNTESPEEIQKIMDDLVQTLSEEVASPNFNDLDSFSVI